MKKFMFLLLAGGSMWASPIGEPVKDEVKNDKSKTFVVVCCRSTYKSCGQSSSSTACVDGSNVAIAKGEACSISMAAARAAVYMMVAHTGCL